MTLEIYGRGDSEPALRAQAAELGIADRVTFHGRIAIDAVPAAVAAADIGLAPTRHDRFTDMSLSTKVFEYAAHGQAGRRVAAADGRAHVPGRHGRHVPAG